MTNLELLFFGNLREITGTNKMEAVITDGSLLSDLVNYLSDRYGEEFGKSIEDIPGLRILINGREYYLMGRMDSPLSDGDTVVFMPPIAGG